MADDDINGGATPAPVISFHIRAHAERVCSALERLVAALAEKPLVTLRSGRAFRLVVDYDEDPSADGWRMKARGTFVLRGGSSMLRIDMRPCHFASDRPALIRLDEPCPPGNRVQPNAASISARAKGILAALRAARPDADARRNALEHVTRLIEAGYAACAGEGPHGSPFARIPGPWEGYPYISAISQGPYTYVPHFMFGETRTGRVHPDLEDMIRRLPGPHANLHVKEQDHRRGGPTWKCSVEPCTQIRFSPPDELDPLVVMRTLASWNPADGRPPLEDDQGRR